VKTEGYVRKTLLTVVVFAMLFWLHGAVQTFMSPLETATALRHVNSTPPPGAMTLMSPFNAPLIVLYGLAIAAIFILWLPKSKKEN
jgi:hypothetical protein